MCGFFFVCLLHLAQTTHLHFIGFASVWPRVELPSVVVVATWSVWPIVPQSKVRLRSHHQCIAIRSRSLSFANTDASLGQAWSHLSNLTCSKDPVLNLILRVLLFSGLFQVWADKAAVDYVLTVDNASKITLTPCTTVQSTPGWCWRTNRGQRSWSNRPAAPSGLISRRKSASPSTAICGASTRMSSLVKLKVGETLLLRFSRHDSAVRCFGPAFCCS